MKDSPSRGPGSFSAGGFDDDIDDVPGTSVGIPSSPCHARDALDAEESKLTLPGSTATQQQQHQLQQSRVPSSGGTWEELAGGEHLTTGARIMGEGDTGADATTAGENTTSGRGAHADHLDASASVSNSPMLPEGEPPESSPGGPGSASDRNPTPQPPPDPPPEDDIADGVTTGIVDSGPSSGNSGLRKGVSFQDGPSSDTDADAADGGDLAPAGAPTMDEDDDDFGVFDEEPEEDMLNRIQELSAKDLTKLASLKSFKSFKGKGGISRKSVWLNPKGAVRARWDAVVVFSILYTSVVLPLRITFGNAENLADPLSIIDFIIDALFMVDIYLNFNTGFDDDGTVVMDAQIVRFHYLRSFFFIDLIATIPFDLLVFCFPDSDEQGETRLYLRLPRLLRLLRLPRMFRYLNRWEDILPINAVALRMFKLLFSVIMFAHMNACMQMLIAELQDFPANSWASRAGVVNDSSVTRYSHAMFRALSHMLCIGYGQEPPYTIIEYWVVIFSMMLGAMFYALLLGMMPTLMLSMDISGSLYTQKVDIWRQYFNYRGITKPLRKRILNYFEYRWHTRKVFSEEDLLGELSTCLQTDIQMHVCEELIRKAPVFHALQPHIVTAIVSYLVPMKISEGEYVYGEGDISDSMYFIQSGEISIESSEGTNFTSLSDGSYFGEFSFLYSDNRTRTACAKASKPTELFMLSQENFAVLTQAFPELLELLLNIADARTAIFMAQKEEKEEQELMGMRSSYSGGSGLDDGEDGLGGAGGDRGDDGGNSGGGSRLSSNGDRVHEERKKSGNEAMQVIDKIKKKGLLSHITLNPGGEQAKLSMASTFAASQRLNQLQRTNTVERQRRSLNEKKRKSKIVLNSDSK